MLAAVHRIPKPAFKRFYVKQKKKKCLGFIYGRIYASLKSEIKKIGL